MLYIALPLILLTLYLITINTRTGLMVWGMLSPLMAHFQYTIAGLPLITFNKYTVIPAFLIHFFSGKLIQNWRLVTRGLIVPLFLYQFVMFVYVWFSEPLTQTFQFYLENEVMPILLFLMIITTEWKRRDIIRFVWIIFGVMQVVSLIAAYEHLTHNPVFFSMKDYVLRVFPHRPTGTFLTVAALNTVLSVAIFFVAPVVLRTRNLVGKFFAWIGIIIILYGNYVAFYRGTVAPMLLLLLLHLLRVPSRRGKTVFGMLVILIVIGFYSVLITESRTFQERITQTVTINTRIATYIHSVKAISEKPFAGWGMYRIREVLTNRQPTFFKGTISKNTPHNTFLLFGIEFGIVGLGAFLFWLWAVFRILWRNYSIANTEYDKDFLFGGVLALIQFILLNMSLSSWSGISTIFLFTVIGFQMAYFQTLHLEDDSRVIVANTVSSVE